MVFLGGTCAGYNWREGLIYQLKTAGIEYFNPVVENWNEEAQKKENEIKFDPKTTCLFFITSDMKGVFSIAEVVQCCYLKPDKTVFCFAAIGFDREQLHSLDAVGRLIEGAGAFWVSPERLINKLKEIEDK